MNDFFSFIYFHTLDFERGTDDLIGINNGEKTGIFFVFVCFGVRFFFLLGVRCYITLIKWSCTYQFSSFKAVRKKGKIWKTHVRCQMKLGA